MRLALRWLSVFAAANVICAAALTAFAFAVALVLPAAQAVWALLFDPAYAPVVEAEGLSALSWIYADITRDKDATSYVVGMAVYSIIPAPIMAWPVARASLDNEGWRFWRWRL